MHETTNLTTNMNFGKTFRLDNTDVATFSASYSTYGNANFNLSVSHLPMYLEYEEDVKTEFEVFKTEVTDLIKRVLGEAVEAEGE